MTWYQERPATPALLIWEPTFAEISGGGDLGYTTGPWQFKPDSTAPLFSTFGHYVSVWKKYPDRKWRVVIDVGIVHAKPETVTDELAFPTLRQRRKASNMNLEKERIKLLDTDRVFAHTSATQGALAAFMSYAAEDVRFYRMNSLPAIGKEKVRAVLSEKSGLLNWQPMTVELSRTGDLGYTYGSAEFKQRADGSEPVARSYYLRIWRKQPDGVWKVVLDLDSPVPPNEGH
jgi:ketosteroid isomerase-like protein